MNLHIAKWGNSLALRIPTDLVRRADIKEGDQVEACLTVDGGICIRAARWDRKAFGHQLEQVRATMPVGETVVAELRREARY